MDQNLPVVSPAKLREAREHAGLTQEQVAPRVHVTRSTIQNYEHGMRVPRADVLAGMARLYRVPIESLFEHGLNADTAEATQTENRAAA